MKKTVSFILLITLLFLTLSLVSCNSGAKSLEKNLEEMGFTKNDNPEEAKEQVTIALKEKSNKESDIEIFIAILEARGGKFHLWQKGSESVVVIECRDIETVMMIEYSTPEPTYDISAINELKQAGRLYSKCYVLSAPDYVCDEIAKMNDFD